MHYAGPFEQLNNFKSFNMRCTKKAASEGSCFFVLDMGNVLHEMQTGFIHRQRFFNFFNYSMAL